jgi:alpha-methylacyl-CoA racemase
MQFTNNERDTPAGPLRGVRVIELAAIGPVPFTAMLLADMGAEILRIDPPGAERGALPQEEATMRGRSRLTLDLKNPVHLGYLREILTHADMLLEGMRPGVLERLGIGPDRCLAINPALVIGRMTGWGQTGPLAESPGHDPNYLAISGALHAMGYGDRPPLPPLNLVGDFGGGALYLTVGLLAALLHARATGAGQVVDAAMLDGVSSLLTPIHAMRNLGMWSDVRGTNLMDGICPFACSYATADDRYVMVAAIEPKFYRALVSGLGLDETTLPSRDEEANWPLLKERFAAVFRTRTRDEWARRLEGTDACVSPILNLGEAREHPQLKSRGIFSDSSDLPAPAPRFSHTPSRHAPKDCGGARACLQRWGVSGEVLAFTRL